VENEELSQLFSAAMEATDRRVEEARVARDDVDADVEEFEDEFELEEDFELDVEIDHTSMNLDVDFLREQMRNASSGAVADALGDDEETPAEPADGLPTIDTTAQIEELLSSSFGGMVSDDDPDLAFPDFGDEDVDTDDGMPEGALAALSGDVNSEALAAAEQQAASIRRQFNQVSRTLAERELELQTAQDRIATLENQVVQATRQTASAGREFQSFRQRAEREQEEARKFAAEKLLKDLLGVLDNLERALEHAGEVRESALGTGVEMTLEQFIATLERAGASRVEPTPGEGFDPNFHEAVGQEEHNSIEVGSIVRVLQKGLVLNGRLVRAAMVVVSVGDGSEVTAETGEGTEAAAAPADTPKKKKKRKKKRKPSPTAEGSEGLEAAETGADEAPRKKKKKKKKRKPSPTAEGSEGLEAAETGTDEAPRKKKKKRKKKRPDVAADADTSEAGQTNSKLAAED